MAQDQYRTDAIRRRVEAMRVERQSFIAHYQELAEFVQPRRGRFTITDRNKGDRRWSSIINSAGTRAHRVARAGMLAGTMSPARPWFALETPDPAMMEFGPVKEWLYKAQNIIREVQNQSNFYNMAPVMIGELLLFGTGCMAQVDDFDDVARFYAHTVGSYMIAQDSKYRVNTVGREFEWSAEQIVGEFGIDNVSATVRNAYDRGDYGSWFPVTHFVAVNEEYSPSKRTSKYKKFKSCYFEPGNADKNQFLSEAGFDAFPFFCPRWEVTGEDIYGTDCPGMTALGDIKGLQIEEKRKAQAIDKMVSPPLKGPPSLRNVAVSSLPGGLTTYVGEASGEGLTPIYQVTPQVQELRGDIAAVEQRIKEDFFNDLFLPISNIEGIQPRNQFDLIQRHEESLLQLGPVLERLHGEFLGPHVDMTFYRCAAAGILPPPPPELENVNLKVNFISTLAMAQRAVATGNIDRVAAFVGGLIKAGFVDAADKFDADQAIDEYAGDVGAPPTIVRPDDKVAEIRAQKQQQRQAAATAELANSASATAKNLAQAQTSEPSALTAVGQAVAQR